MKHDTPIKNLVPRFICAECQQAAIDKAAGNTHAVQSVCFQYCERTRRGLTLFSSWGQPTQWMVSDPGDRDVVEALYNKVREQTVEQLQTLIDAGAFDMGDDSDDEPAHRLH